MSRIVSDFLEALCKDTLRAFYRHPIEIAVGIAMAFLITRGLRNEQFEFLLQMGIAAPLVALSAFALSCLHAMNAIDRRARVGWTTLFVVLSIGYGLWCFADSRMVTSELWRWVLLVVGLGAVIMSVPLVARSYSALPELRFWRFNARLAVRIFVCASYLGLLFGGLRLGLGALDVLFESSILWHNFTFDLGIWLFVGFGPWVILAGSEAIFDLDRPMPDTGIYWIARLGSFLLLPLIAVYLLITYTYTIRIGFSDFAPSNVISPLILGAGLLGFLGLYLVEPLRHRKGYDLLSRIFQCFPVALLAVLPLSLWAVLERVNQYGWTEFRYLRFLAIIAFAVLCIYSGVQLLRRKPMPVFVVPLVVAAAAFLATMGPWSVIEVSRSSQLQRLTNAAEAASILTDDTRIDMERFSETPKEERREIVHQVSYLRRHHGATTMKHLAPKGTDDLDTWAQGLWKYHGVELR